MTSAFLLALFLALCLITSSLSWHNWGVKCDLNKGQITVLSSRPLACASSVPAVEHGFIYDTHIRQVQEFGWWTNLSIYLFSSSRFCSHLTYIEGSQKDAETFINSFNINVSDTYFVTAFTQSADIACQPSMKPHLTIRGFAITSVFLAAFANIIFWLLRTTQLTNTSTLSDFEQREFEKIYSISLICVLVLSPLFVAILWGSTYSYCNFKEECVLQPGGIPVKPIEGKFQNVSCGTEVCQITWFVHESEALGGICIETLPTTSSLVQEAEEGQSKTLIINPSSKIDCRQLPNEWQVHWWIMMFLCASFVLCVVIMGLYLVGICFACGIYRRFVNHEEDVNILNSTVPLLQGEKQNSKQLLS